MIDETEDVLPDDLDDIESVAGHESGELHEHFRVVVDKGQTTMRVDKFLCESIVN